MPEPTVPTPPADPPTPPAADPPTPVEPTEPKDWQAEAEKWQKFSRQNEQRAKDNAAAAKRLGEIEDAAKSDAEKLTEKLAAAEERATKANKRAVSAQIKAMATGRFADAGDAVDALGGDFLAADGQIDDAAIEAALTDLLERKPHWKAETGPRTPRPDPSQGPRPGGTVGVEDQIREATAKGDWKTVLSLQNSKLAAAPRPK